MSSSGNSNVAKTERRGVGREPIAIVGMGCRLPGGVNDWLTFWEALESGKDCISETPADRWSLDQFYSLIPQPGKTQSKWGGYLDSLADFDPELFGISPREAASMDPQQRLLLESSFRAVEDAGKRLDQLAGRAVAVFVGISSFDYAMAGLSFKDRGVIDAYSNTGGSSSIAANRISYCLDLRGPSVAVDTACSSSLVAVHLACESLWRGESEMALAGGVNALILPDFYVAFSQLGVLSPDGRCRTFDAKASGYVRSEGAGVVLLKPLRTALRDKDPVYAVIRGTALNQDGRTPGMTVPSQSAQESLIRMACQCAGVDPKQLQYVEAHGTGTPVGDPIEAAAIGAAAGAGRAPEDACWIGSVKTNIGHLESGAGAASLIKVALALHHGRIPRNLHFQNANPAIDLKALGLRVPTDTILWKSEGPRLAGINGFGYGGTNAHVILEQAPDIVAEVFSTKPSQPVVRNASLDKTRASNLQGQGLSAKKRTLNTGYPTSIDEVENPSAPVLLPISARSLPALRQTVQRLSEWLAGAGANYHLAEIAGYLAHRRSHLDNRAAICASDHASMIDRLQTLAASLDNGDVQVEREAQLAKGLAFVCSGQGPQWWAMGRGLLRFSPVFRSVLKRCDAEFSRYAPWSLLEELEKSEGQSRMHLTSIAQPSIFAIQVALAAVWESWGVRPSAIVGHSVGEIAAAYLAGALEWEDACWVAFHRGRTMDLASSQGGMLAVGLAPEEVPAWIQGLENDVSIAAINGPNSLTIAGAAQAIDELAERLEPENIFCRRLAVEYAFHSPQMDPVRDELLESLKDIRPRTAHTKFISTVTGKAIDGREVGAEYWWRNVRQSVRFAEAMACLAEENYGLLVEIGPHPVLSYSISECFQAANRSVRTVPSLNRQQSDLQCISNSLGTLYSLGVEIQWSGFYNQPLRKVPVPTYPLQWHRLWNESLESLMLRQTGQSHPLLGQRADHAQISWHQRIDLKRQDYYADHRVRGSIVYPAAGIVETVVAAAKILADQSRTIAGELRSDQLTQSAAEKSVSAGLPGVRLERLQLHNPCILEQENPCWMETQFHSNRRQITLGFRSCKISGSGTSRTVVSPGGSPSPDRSPSPGGAPTQALGTESSDVDLSFRPNSQTLRLPEGGATRWTPLATVTMSRQPEAVAMDDEHLDRIQSARSRCAQAFTAKQLYDYCARLGLDYGQKFQGVVGGVWRAGEAVAQVKLPDLVDAHGYFIHPALLDSCFHAMIAADASFDHALDGLYLPAEIREVTVSGLALELAQAGKPVSEVIVHARVLGKTRKRMWCDLDVTTLDDRPILTIRGFESHRVVSPSTVVQTADLIYGYRWQKAAPKVAIKEVSGNGLVVDEKSLDRTNDLKEREQPVLSSWIVFMDEGGVGRELCQRFRVCGHRVIEVYQANSHVSQISLAQSSSESFFQVNPESLADFELMFSRLNDHQVAGVIYLWGLDAPDVAQLCTEGLRGSTILTNVAPLHLVQAWNEVGDSLPRPHTTHENAELNKNPSLCLVTRGAQVEEDELQATEMIESENSACQIAQAPLVGFGRVVISEYSRLSAKLMDLPPVAPGQGTASGDIDLLFQQMLTNDGEDEIMLRGGSCWVHRFVPLADQTLSLAASRELPVQLRPGCNAGIEELRYATKARGPLAAGQVEIEVIAAGLNFSDVMKALDLYPGLGDSSVELGAECSGRISRVAPGSRWAVGTEVIAIAPGAFSSHVIVNEQLVAKKPFNLSFEEAAAIPVAFLTAQYALHQCARLKRGESILIHAASGGVGLAAIQLANAAGLRILATAGTLEKRNYLSRLGISHVMDSRTLAFGQQTLEATAGEGVDAVLNSLPGEAIATGLSVLKLGGRFLEIGKRDIYNDASLGLFPFRKNLSLFAIDLDQLFKHQPGQMGLLLQSLVQRFELGELRPLPTTVFETNDTAAAFRYMQQSKHIGKVVVHYQTKPNQVVAGTYDSLELRSDRTYWVAGGLGGFGLEVAKWLVSRGAKHLVLGGRSRTLTPEVQAAVDQLGNEGVSVNILPTDITQPSSVQETLSTIDAELPPLAGVIHTAMVLEDRLLVDLDRETLERVLWPKVLGGWNLHQQTRQRELDLFVVFSSLSSVFGHAGQANYSAANALLDSLAHYRRQLGLPGLVINWGHLGEVGYLAQREQLGQRLERQGVLSFSVQQAMDCLEFAIQTRATQLSVLRMDWSVWRGLGITGRVSPRFAHLLRSNESPVQSSGDAVSSEKLRRAEPAQRSRMVAEMLRSKIGTLLGLSPTQVRDDRAPLEMGLDSLMAVELRNWIEAQLEIGLQVSNIMRSGSLSELTAQICQLLGSTECHTTGAVSAQARISSASGNVRQPESRENPEVDGMETEDAISSQQASEFLKNIDQLSSQQVNELLGKLLT